MNYHHYIRKLAGTAPIILTAAGVVVTNKSNQLLVFKRIETGVWDLPGGHMDIGESLEETAIRETFEETGIILNNIELIKLVSGKDAIVQDTNGVETHYVTAIYSCTNFSGELCGSTEGQEVAFFNLDAVPQPMSKSVEAVVDYMKQKSGEAE